MNKKLSNVTVYINGKYNGKAKIFATEYIPVDYIWDNININCPVSTLAAKYTITMQDDMVYYPYEVSYEVKTSGDIIIHAKVSQGGKPKTDPSKEAGKLPGFNKVVKHPILNENWHLQYVITSLNDYYQWTREQIADWLESLDIDLTFKEKK